MIPLPECDLVPQTSSPCFWTSWGFLFPYLGCKVLRKTLFHRWMLNCSGGKYTKDVFFAHFGDSTPVERRKWKDSVSCAVSELVNHREEASVLSSLIESLIFLSLSLLVPSFRKLYPQSQCTTKISGVVRTWVCLLLRRGASSQSSSPDEGPGRERVTEKRN